MSDLEVVSFRPERDQYAWTFGGVAPVKRLKTPVVLEVYTEDAFGGRATSEKDLVSQVIEFPPVEARLGRDGTLGRPLVQELRRRGHEVWGCDLQHQPDAGDGKNEDRAKFPDVEFTQYQWRDQHQHRQQPVPEPVSIMPPQRDILTILGFEQVAHRSDSLSHAFREQALRDFDSKMDS